MQQSEDMIKDLLEILTKTHEEELPCDEVFELMDEFADAKLRGEDVAQLMPLVQRHLELCRDCIEEYDALMRVLKSE